MTSPAELFFFSGAGLHDPRPDVVSYKPREANAQFVKHGTHKRLLHYVVVALTLTHRYNAVRGHRTLQ